MKNKVKFSTLSQVLTVVVLILFIVGFFFTDSKNELVIYSIIVIPTILFSFYYCPISVEADASGITLNRLMSKPKRFEYKDLKLVDTCIPSAGSIRLCGSGGFLGYWGYFNDIIYGNYFGYYGSRDHCFIIELKNGKKYILGCDDNVTLVKYIKSQINKQIKEAEY